MDSEKFPLINPEHLNLTRERRACRIMNTLKQE